jgi:glycosyltransferase involved in cell wall biosynthesis
MNKNKKISVVSSCYNEEGNLQEFYNRVTKILAGFPKYSYEIIMAENCSTDRSREILRKIAEQDKNFKVILNACNVGPNRSSYNALLHASGDAAIPMSSDLQDPPEIISDFIKKWESGYHVVVGIKTQSKENSIMFGFRRFFYWLLSKFSDDDQIIPNFTGFGLYDRKVLDAMRLFNEPAPYIRGLVSKIGFRRTEVEFTQPLRKHGRSKNNFFTLYSTAMTGFVNHSKLPLRLATFLGFCLAGISLLIALGYFIYKIAFWDTFNLGIAPVVIGLFFFSAVQLIFIGIIGEYIGAILTQVKNHPLVIEEEKINFD